ncbi:MAG TPA: pilus assembly protein TadG-related protein [Thermoguttaceae bacterium]|nr:pilus assembly protein TadG-related protein [Thermoguttaceae bacterium]
MKRNHTKMKRPPRRGATLILSVFLIFIVAAMVAFAVDIGQVVLMRTQLQVAADSAAMAAGTVNMTRSADEVIATARQFSDYHTAGGKQISLDPSDVEFGCWDYSRRTFTPTVFSVNAVRVTTRRWAETDSESPLVFGKLMGVGAFSMETKAVAAFVENFIGFQPPSSGDGVPMLPIAIDQESWAALETGGSSDAWTWDEETQQVIPVSDGLSEVNIYPQDTGAAGNCGTVDIGPDNNSTADLRRQILDGLSAEDLSYHGGELALEPGGALELGGDPGLSAGIESALEAVIGQPRIVPVYSQVSGSGNNARYTIVGFAGIRVMDVNLSGNKKDKRLTVQRATVVVRGGIPSWDSDVRTSRDIVSPSVLVQ